MAKPSFQINAETLKLVDETAKKIGLSRSDLIRMSINEKLYRLGVLKLDGTTAQKIGGD
ncbi:MAG: ribbon-helix-helix domain-containing protein [Candidatus Bathyarchaeota archaeon]|nr:ribbon-helix-helix domain-containing protein [Candidatus Bathyarchaeota archaeon]